MIPTNSFVLNSALIQSLSLNSLYPNTFTEEEFNHLRIINLLKLGQRAKAFEMINNIDENLINSDFYNSFKFIKLI